MDIADLITSVRTDYLDDSIAGELWDNNFMFRAFTEAQRQVCNRQNILFDDSTAEYTSITLVDGTASYALSPKITDIEQVIFDSLAVTQLSKHELERSTPAWRAKTGMTGKVVNYIIRGKSIRFIPSPDADDDAKVVSLEVFRLPAADITATTDIPEIPEEFHRDLIYWVLHEACKKQDADTYNQERSDYFLNRFTEVFGEYISAEVRLNKLQQRGSLHLRPTAYTTNLTTSSSSDDWDNF